MHKARLFAAFLFVAAPVEAGEGQLDTGFGDAGFRIEGFQPGAQGGPIADADIGLVACSAPQGRLIASGLASGISRVVTMFLTPDGRLDASIGFGGKQSVALPEAVRQVAVGLCQADGKPVLAWNEARTTDPDDPRHVLHLLRLGHDGLADAGFGVGGFVRLDLEAYVNRTVSQRPLVLIAGPDGDIVLAGSFERRQRERSAGDALAEHGFIARITSTGSVTGVTSAASTGSRVTRYVGGGFGDGALQLVGTDAVPGTGNGHLVFSQFAYPSLQWAFDTDQPSHDAVRPLGGRMIGTARHAIVARDGRPEVVVSVLDASWHVLPLPVPRLGEAPAHLRSAQLAATADGGVLVVGAISREPASAQEGIYAAKLRRVPGGYAVDWRFGQGGQTVVDPPADCAPIAPAVLAFARFTFWRGAPTVIGAVDRTCRPDDPDYDYAVFRLDTPLFRGDFESLED